MTDAPADALPCHQCANAHSPPCPGIGHCLIILAWLDGADVLPITSDRQKLVTEGGPSEGDQLKN
jgi:hypothetical protein